MKTKDLRNAGLIALAAGLVLVPLARYVMNRKKAVGDAPEPLQGHKRLFSAYFGKHGHHRRSLHDGHHYNN